MNIKEITLLTIEEARLLSAEQLKFEDIWWLRSPGRFIVGSRIVRADGKPGGDGGTVVDNPMVCVRPALKVEFSNFHIGDRINLLGYDWTLVLDDTFLCGRSIGEHCFRRNRNAPDANVWEASDLKPWLEQWLREQLYK